MPHIGPSTQALVVRTDFSDEPCWRSVCAQMLAETAEGFRAHVDVIEDPGFDGLGTDAVLAAVEDDYRLDFLIVGDHVTVTNSEHLLLVLDLIDEPGRSFRALPGEIQSIENNLSIANMDFSDFAEAAEPDGVFRGFR